jgi:hypothetical protein
MRWEDGKVKVPLKRAVLLNLPVKNLTVLTALRVEVLPELKTERYIDHGHPSLFNECEGMYGV